MNKLAPWQTEMDPNNAEISKVNVDISITCTKLASGKECSLPHFTSLS
jgi:hypothetical protein